MSRETDLHLRLMSQADKELKITSVNVFGSPSEIESQLTLGYSRKGMALYNNSDSASGEILWGSSSLTTANGMPIPKGALFDVPCSTDIPIYVMNTISGENGDLRMIEIA